jgi:hypothetical protein
MVKGMSTPVGYGVRFFRLVDAARTRRNRATSMASAFEMIGLP